MDTNNRRLMRHHNALSCVLSAGLVCGPYNIQYPDVLDYEYHTVESLGLEELGLDKKIKKLVKPIQDLNLASGKKGMAVTAVKFLKDMNDMFGTKYTIEDGIYQSALVMQKNGHQVNQKKFAALQKLLHDAQKSLGLHSDYEMKKDYGDVDQMCEAEIRGYLSILCGALLCIIPNPYTIGIGCSLIAYGVAEASFNAGKEKDWK